VQECAPESLELKRELFARLDAEAPPPTVLASSSSALVASVIAADLQARGAASSPSSQPSLLLPVVEVVPPVHRGVGGEAYRGADAIGGPVAVRIRHEIEGFAFTGCRERCCARPIDWCAMEF